MANIEQGSISLSSATTISVIVTPYTIIGNGKTTVTTAGTAVQLASSTACKTVTIRALSTNAGLLYVGSSSVSSANGFQISSSQTISMDIDNLSKVWLDCATNGDGATYVYLS